MRSLSNLLKFENIETSQIPYDINKTKKTDSRGKRAASIRTIKSDNPVLSAREEAKRILEEADELAAEMVQNAETTARREHEEARVKGFAEGLKSGKAEVKKENSIVLEEIKQIYATIEEHKNRLLKDNKQSIIELAYKIADKVVNQKLSDDETLFLKIYEKAAKDLVAQKWVKLSVSECDVKIATTNSEMLLKMVSGAERLEIEVLEDVPRGTCIVETSEKIVDASVNTQLCVLSKATAEN